MIAAQARAFEALLGADSVRVIETEHPEYRPHPVPLVHLIPRTRAETIETVRLAAAERIPLVPVGGNTSPRVPAPGSPPACLLSTEMLDRVIAFEAEDFTLTAEAGLALADARLLLEPRRQFLPLSAPDGSRATLGGIVACHRDGPTRHPYGAVRDQILGMEVVHGDGRVSKTGGRVVKNVTGYDLARLYAGSRGVLGITLSMTLRLRPREQAGCDLLLLFGTRRAAFEAALDLRRSLPEILTLHLLAGRALDGLPGEGLDRTGLVARLRGSEDLVEALGEACFERDLGATEREILPRAAVTVLEQPVETGWAHLRVAVLPSQGLDLVDVLDTSFPGERGWVYDVNTGIGDLGLPGGWPLSPAGEAAVGEDLSELRAIADLPSDPTFHLRRFTSFPSSRPDGVEIMQGLMRALDPHGILNPGRYEVSP